MVSFHTTLETLAQEVNDTKAENIVTLLQEHVKEIRSEDLPLLKEIRAKLGEETPASKQIAGIIQNLHPVKFSIGDKERVVFINALKECAGLHEMVLDIGETEEAIPLPETDEVLLDFLEGKEVDIDDQNVYAILHIADKWGAPELIDKCCERILKGFRPDATFLGLKRNLRCAIISRMDAYQIQQAEQALPPKESLPTKALQDARDQVKEYLSINDIWIPLLKKHNLLSKKDFQMKEGLAREFYQRRFDWDPIVREFKDIPFIKEILESHRSINALEMDRSFNAAEIEMLKEFIHARDLAIFRNQLASEIDQPGIDFSQPYETWKLEAEGLDAWMAIHEEQLKKLKILDLVELEIYELPAGIQMLTNLEQLYLMGNRLTRLPQEITQLKKLEILFLGDNQLRKIPKELRELKQLKELYVESNEIQVLPEWIKELTSLKKLHVYGNKLKRHPAWIKELEERGCKVHW